MTQIPSSAPQLLSLNTLLNKQQLRAQATNIAPNIAPINNQAVSKLLLSQNTQQGQAAGMYPLALDPPPPFLPQWSAKTQKAVVATFTNGLKQNNIKAQELSDILKAFQISTLEVTPQNIQNPNNAAEVRYIQTYLNSYFDSIGLKSNIEADGQFGKRTVDALVALRDSYRGEPVAIGATPQKQVTHDGCFRASEAMLFNVLHSKEGSGKLYTEKDVNKGTLKTKGYQKSDANANAANESSTGKITFARKYGMTMLNKIDNELNSGRPVIVGVSSRKQNPDRAYNEGITDHFVLVTGRQYDAQGVYYTFNDPFAGGTGTFRLDPFKAKLAGIGDSNRKYDVSHVTAFAPIPVAKK